jgi:glycosyltransferase involved in cell wall biosynthesis
VLPPAGRHPAPRCAGGQFFLYRSRFIPRISEGPGLRITFVIGLASLAGGVRVVAIYARKLAERGHQVTVVSQQPRDFDSPRRRLKRLLNPGRAFNRKGSTPIGEIPGVRHVVVPRGYPFDPATIPDGDAIVATWWETAFAVADLPAEKGARFYFVQHHEVHEHLQRHLSAGSYHLPLKKITIADWLVETMATRYGDHDVAKVENSVDLGQFHAPERQKQARPTVGLLYSTTPFKGVPVSLAAIERARARVPDLQVVAFGSRPLDPGLPLPPGSRYFEKPAQEAIRDIYAMCDVWLCGSRAEGFHLPPSEAMACRCPVVSTRIGGAVEIVTEGVNGHIVDVGDSAALGDRLADVLTASPAAWKAMSDAALARVRGYTWDDATDRFERILLDGVRPGRSA